MHEPHPADAPVEVIHHFLERVRRELDLDLAFVAEFAGGRRVFRYVEGGSTFGVSPEGSDPLNETYCQRILDGRIPGVIPDARGDPRTEALGVTQKLGIGCYVGVPIVLSTGRVYGTLCAAGHTPRPDLDERDLGFLRAVGGMLAEQLERIEADRDLHRETIERVRAVLEPGPLSVVVQPIFDLTAGQIVGVEALSRFDVEPRRPPDAWFRDAWSVGLGLDLELEALRLATGVLGRLPEPVYLSVNVSPETLLADRFGPAIAHVPPGRLVVEVTEHVEVEDYAQIQHALEAVMDRGVRLAVDDAGAGFSGLSHILQMSPDIIKLDIVLTRGIDHDVVRQALATALVDFSARVEAVIVAEGIETQAELATLRSLGVTYGQGYHLARPGPPEDVLATNQRAI